MVIRPSQSGRNWNALSENYRSRLERNGVSRRDYERGASVTAARGHAQTPERPQQAERQADRFPDYQSRRESLIASVQRMKRELFGTAGKWNEARAFSNVRTNPVTGKPRGIRELALIEKMFATALDDDLSYDEIFAEEDISDDIESAFYYH